MDSRRLMEGLDIRALERLRSKHPDGPQKNPQWLKFLDWRLYGQHAIDWTVKLGLQRNRGLRILDVGCGFGYFVRACNLLGHQAIGLDMPDPFYAEVWQIMRVPVVAHAMVIDVALPEPLADKSFDLITLFGFGLPRVRKPDGSVRSARNWTEYSQMIRQLLRYLDFGGMFYVALNLGPDRPWLWNEGDWKAIAREAKARLMHEGRFFAIQRRDFR